MELRTNDWKYFKLSELFSFKRGKGITTFEIAVNPGTIPCIQSGEFNNGIIGFMDDSLINDKKHTYIKAPFLSVARSGTSGIVHIQNRDCYVGDSAYALKLITNGNIFVYAFMATVLNKEKYRYAYGRKVSIEKYIERFIKLPVNETGNPDFAFMETYCKHLFAKYSSDVIAQCFNRILQET
jgi:restriction endonuclease S subunit